MSTPRIIIILCFLSSLLIGQETDSASLDARLTENALFLVDSNNRYTFETVKKVNNFSPISPSLKVKPKEAIWVKVSGVSNQAIKYISVGNFDYVEMYIDKGYGEKLLNGRLTPLEDRVINGFPILFPLTTDDLNKSIYFKIQHKNPLAREIVQLNLLTEKERNENLRVELNRHNSEAIFTGGILILFIFFLFFAVTAFLFTKKSYYIFYSLYIITNLILLLVSVDRFSNLHIFLSGYPNFLTKSEPLLFAIISISYNLFLKKFIASTREIQWMDIVLNGFIAYAVLTYFFTPYLREIFNDHYLTHKLHEAGFIPLFIGTSYFLYNLFKSEKLILKLLAGGLFLIFWIGPCLYILSQLGENQTFFLNPNMPLHLLMIAELIFFTLILGYDEYQTQINLEKEKVDLKYKLSDVEKAALQAQIHPHFISNCLTSIQSFVLQNDPKKAVRYLSKFSRLVRHNLHASVDGVLTIKEEVDFLDIYLTLEKQRHNDTFDYKITVPNNPEIEKMTIAPLLIQPYVENAVLHGIAAKEKDGMINIDFLIEEETLIIKVKDNGIGFNLRKQNHQKKMKHKSVGMTITHDRLKLLDYGEKVEIHDLSDIDATQQGTEVSIYIKIPDYEKTQYSPRR